MSILSTANVSALWKRFVPRLPWLSDSIRSRATLEELVAAIEADRNRYRSQSDQQLRDRAALLRQHSRQSQPYVGELFALTAEVAHRVLNLDLFPVQILGALALQDGRIAEMQTGEGKTLTAVLPAVCHAFSDGSAHVWTANDYLARRDAQWMGDIYRFLGLRPAWLAQEMNAAERRDAYAADVLYATPNEIGFDHLRDNLCLHPTDRVQRPFRFALVDEADSILLDEARIPLVIAGDRFPSTDLAYRMDELARSLRFGVDYTTDEFRRNIQLTDLGARKVESFWPCDNIYDARHLPQFTAIHDALHAHILLRRDVDYVVKGNRIELVDENKGRIALNRRWPAGLQTAIEAKESVPLQAQGRILGSLTLHNLVMLYPKVAGMTGTAARQADEFWEFYRLPVTRIPTHRPMIRIDQPDVVFHTRKAKEHLLLHEIATVHATGRPILVGTASVAESERLSALLREAGIAHHVLNARQDEHEAEIIAQAGALGAVTISTNMAGRGTDIELGGRPARSRDEVLALGGLYVIGTNRHESRRIDDQLRGRAGRQGDPGASRFFVSLDDDLLVRFGIGDLLRQRPTGDAINAVQRLIEGQNLQIRQTAWKYDGLTEHHRRQWFQRRDEVMAGTAASQLPEELRESLLIRFDDSTLREWERLVTLVKMDEAWSDYLAAIAELKNGIHWRHWGGRDPLREFLDDASKFWDEMQRWVADDVSEFFERLQDSSESAPQQLESLLDRGATWTYLITDEPFGTLTERVAAGLRRKLQQLLSA